ncbi:MAG: EF-P beta-lysylation protein EpmB [Gammaproteobacteria bacterium]
MIARRSAGKDTPTWREQLAQAYRDPRALLAALDLDARQVDLSPGAAATFPFRVTRAYAGRIEPGNAADPLLRQVLPIGAEMHVHADFGADPVGERKLANHGNLLQKYAGRALLVMTGACAIHCRYCFRRTYPYADHSGRSQLERGLAAIGDDPTIREVILSGGDPLVLDDDAIADICVRLAAISHVRRVRLHSRLPVVLPARLTPRLLALLGGQRFPVVLVIHANHPQEIDRETTAALTACHAVGVTLLNQAVLLRGVNDDAEVLGQLCEKLFAAGVLPYYVHLLDRVAGAAHFDVEDPRARAIERALRATLPGYLMPRFVREVAGAAAKLPMHELKDA